MFDVGKRELEWARLKREGLARAIARQQAQYRNEPLALHEGVDPFANGRRATESPLRGTDRRA